MAKVGRNHPCPCGSTKKAKRYCYGPVVYVDVRILPFEHKTPLSVLPGTTEIELRALFNQLTDLPKLDLSLQVPLPGVHTPDIDQAGRALRHDEGEEFDRHVARVVPTVDSAERRIKSGKAIIASGTRAASHPSSPPWPSSNSTESTRCSSHPRWPHRLESGRETSTHPTVSSSPLDRHPISSAYWRALSPEDEVVDHGSKLKRCVPLQAVASVLDMHNLGGGQAPSEFLLVLVAQHRVGPHAPGE
jgi:hypothetical protein